MTVVERPQRDRRIASASADAAPQHGGAPLLDDPAVSSAIALLGRLDAELDRGPAADRAAQLHYERAHLLERPLGRHEEALAAYQDALVSLPAHLPALRGVRRCALHLGRHDEALSALAREASLAPGVPQRAALLRLRARLVAARGGDPDAARQAWRAVLTLVPEDLTALRALERLERAAGDAAAHAAAVTALGGATRVAPELRAALLVHRARLAEGAGDLNAAIDFYQRALLCTEAPGAAGALARLLAATGRWMELAAVLEAEVARTDVTTTRVALLLEIARVTEERLGDPDAAVRVLERAASAAPQSAPVLDELARHYTRDQRWAALREVLERRAHGLAAVDERVAAWSRLAELCATHLGDDRGAEQWFRAALSLDPNQARALRGLGALLARQERWRDAVEVALAEADAAISADLRAAACARAGAAAERHLADPAFAIAQHERALTLVPGYPPSYTALVRLYDETGRSDDRVALHERAADWAATPNDAVHQLLMAATLYETRLASPRHAVAVYERVLALAPERTDALHALQRAAAAAAMFPELLAAIDRELALRDGPGAPSTKRQVALELRAGAVCDEALGVPDRAIERYRHALALEPGCPAAWDALERLYRRLGRAADLTEALEALLEHEPAGPGAVARLLELAHIHEEELARPGAALAYLERALHQRPRDREVLTTLAATLGRAGLYPRQAEILSLLIEVTEDPAARAYLACQLGELARERLGDPWLAADSFERALAARPEWRPARDALARLSRDPKAEEAGVATRRALVRALTRDAARADDPVARREVALAAVHHLVDGLDDAAAAAERLDAILAADPGDLAALLEREHLIGDGADVAAAVANTRALAEALAAPALAAPLLVESAWVAIEGGLDDGTAALWRALELQPGHQDALLLLEQIAFERGDDSLSRRVDARLLAGTPAAAAATMGDRFSRLAETLEAGGDGGALVAWMDTVQADPGSLSAAWGLYRVAERDGDIETVAVALQHLAESTSDDAEAADLLLRLGRVRGAALRDPEGEIAALDAALVRCPDHAAAADRLVEVARRADAVRGALPVLRRAARGAVLPERVNALWRQIGAWHEGSLAERGAAIAAYEEAIAAEPSDASLLEHLAELYLRDAQSDQAVRRLEAAIEQTEDPARCRAVTRRLAEVVAESGDESWACGLLDDVIGEDPGDLAARRQRFALYRGLGRRREAVDEGRVLIAACDDDAERAALHLDVASLLDAEGDGAAAFEARLEAVAFEGLCGEAARGCQPALTEEEAAERYLAALERWADGHQEAVDAAYHHETARIRVQLLGRPEEGLDALVAAVRSAPRDLSLRETLVRTLVLGDEAEEAVAVARDLVLIDTSRVSAWRALRAAFMAAGEETLARRALDGVVAAGGASAAEREELAQSPDRWVSAGMTPEALRLLGEERQESWATERLVAELSEHVEALEPDALDFLHLPQCEVIEPELHPLWAEADRVAGVFGVESFTLLGGPEPGGRVRVAPGGRVVVPAGFHTAAPAVRRFELARAFAMVGRGLEPVEVLGAGLLRALIAAGERLVNPSVPEPAGLRPGLVDELTRRLSRGVPRRARGYIEDCAADTLREGPSDLLVWRTAWSRTAVRAALLVTGDLGAALPRIASTWGSDGVRDAIGFWVSEVADRTRRELTTRGRGGGARGW